MKTGDILQARVLKVTGSEIIYYKIFKLKDPKLKMPKSDVEYIHYENGKIVFMSGKNPMKKNKKKPTTTTLKKKTTVKKK